MNEVEPFYNGEGPARVGCLMSGSGTNVERILQMEQSLNYSGMGSPFHVVAIVADRECRAEQIGEEYGVHVEVKDVNQFYREDPYSSLEKSTLRTPEGRRIREEFTDELRELLNDFDLDIGVMGGFQTLVNIVEETDNYSPPPFINIHPGDLTYLENGKRILTGLHTEPIEKAIARGFDTVRSSVIEPQPYTEDGSDMDNGTILGLGPQLYIGDQSNPDPKEILGQLKEVSDLAITPTVLLSMASGNLGMKDDQAYARTQEGGEWRPATEAINMSTRHYFRE